MEETLTGFLLFSFIPGRVQPVLGNTLLPRFRSRLRLITIDHRGWGQSDSHSSGFHLAGLASDVKEVVKTLKLDRYVLVGHSMGGKVAQFIASERPEKLSGLILVAPAMPGPLRFPPERREGMVNVMNSADLIQQTIDNMLTAKRLSPEVNAQVIEDGLRGSPEAKRAWPLSTSQEDLREVVGQIEVPTSDHRRRAGQS